MTIYHIYVLFLFEVFIKNISKDLGITEIIFLIITFFIELIMILVFVEIIEINCCGLSKNFKCNIELRADTETESYLIKEDDERKSINN